MYCLLNIIFFEESIFLVNKILNNRYLKNIVVRNNGPIHKLISIIYDKLFH
jgi:hypothetical protein